MNWYKLFEPPRNEQVVHNFLVYLICYRSLPQLKNDISYGHQEDIDGKSNYGVTRIQHIELIIRDQYQEQTAQNIFKM